MPDFAHFYPSNWRSWARETGHTAALWRGVGPDLGLLGKGNEADGGKIVLRRHAEKLETSPHLSAAGHLHAERLALTIPDKYGVPDVVYACAKDATSDRAVETAQPLVDKYDIKFKDHIPHGDIDHLVSAVRKRAAKGNFVLVIWRHDELPQIARALGMKDVPDKWDGDDFSTQWEIDVNDKGKALAKGDADEERGLGSRTRSATAQLYLMDTV